MKNKTKFGGSNMEKPGCVVLAAGMGKRFGTNKLTTALDGRSLILRALETVPTECFSSVIVVTQYPEILKLAGEFHFAAIHNDNPEQGLSRSIHLGLTALRDCPAVCFQVSDQPLLRRESVAALANFWHQQPEQIAALAHGGVRGNPWRSRCPHILQRHNRASPLPASPQAP